MLQSLSFGVLIVLTAIFAHSYARRVLSSKSTVSNIPVTVPYFLPWIGSLVSFNRNPLGFFQECRRTFGSVYKIFLAGRTIVVISEDDGISAITRDDSTRYLTHKEVNIPILRAICGPSPRLDFVLDLLDSRIFPYTRQALTTTSMHGLTSIMDPLLEKEIRALCETGNSKSIKLSDFVSIPLYRAGCYALFGPTFPFETFSDFQQLDAHLPQLLTNLPFLGRQGARARERILVRLGEYLDPWWDNDMIEDIEGASHMVMQALVELKASQLSKQEVAGILLLIITGYQSNIWLMTFWLMAHLLVDETAMTRLRNDLRSPDGRESSVDDARSSSSLIDSAIFETLRWATTSSIVRFAEEDTELMIQGQRVSILKGEYVMGDVRAVHYNPNIFDCPDEFHIDRYTSNVDLPKPSAWGAGKNMCPGRHLALHVMRNFIRQSLGLYIFETWSSGSSSAKLPAVSPRNFMGSLRTSEEVYVTVRRRTNWDSN